MIIVEMMGGLGNQMFVYAFARSLNVNTKEKIVFVTQKNFVDKRSYCTLDRFFISDNVTFDYGDNIYKDNCPFRILILKTLRNHLLQIGIKHPKEKMFLEKYLQMPLNLLGIGINSDGYCKIKRFKFTKNFIGWGYFQSSKYFDKYKDTIQNELRVKTELSKENEDYLHDIETSESVCVHIRRGDYTAAHFKNLFLVCNKQYYENAIRQISKTKNNLKFFVFSDDIAWCKENIDFPKNVVFVDNGNTAYEDMRLMYNCKNFIISNSSFSWWAQYLSKATNKVVYAPKKWYGDGRSTGLYLDTWCLIDV